MALRVMSGVIVVRQEAFQGGSVTLNLETNKIRSTDPATLARRETRTIGDRPFLGAPCYVAALRRVRVHPGEVTGRNNIDLNVNAKLLPLGSRPKKLDLSWRATHDIEGNPEAQIVGTEIREIAYLIIGEMVEPRFPILRPTIGRISTPRRKRARQRK
jgi:hypothetical protein